MPVTLTIEQRNDPAIGNDYTDAVLPAPDGWTWYQLAHWFGEGDVDMGTLRVSSASRVSHTLADKMVAVVAWAKEHDIYIEGNGPISSTHDGRPVRILRNIRVNPIWPFDFDQGKHWFDNYACPNPNCVGLINNTMLTCPFCEYVLECVTCHAILGGSKRLLYNSMVEGVSCSICTRTCDEPGCDNVINPEWRYCTSHGPGHFECLGCDTVYDRYVTPMEALPAGNYCTACANSVCMECGERSGNLMPTDVGSACPPCWEKAMEGRMESAEVSALTAEEWLAQATPERPYRLVSIEQEFDSRPRRQNVPRYGPSPSNELAADLYARELSPYREVAGYHVSGHAYPAHIETDSSVPSGGELVISMLRLDTQADAEAMVSIQEAVKTRLEAEDIVFSAKCGTHVHIDMHGYTVVDARNKVTIYSYLEDVIFRLGSSGFSDHRSVVSGNHYALPIKKDKWGDIKKFGVEFLRRADHTDSLNMQHFYNSMKSCKCGAIEFGSMAECECIRKKCTAEWRVFNGTGNPRRLHAYIGIVQAVTAWSQDRVLALDDFEPMEFDATTKFTVQNTFRHLKTADMWKERLVWMFENLPFTDAERESIMYCIETSPLRYIGEEFIASLRAIVRVPEEGRSLPTPALENRNSANGRSDHPYGFDVLGRCRNCRELERRCYCGMPEESDEPDWM